MAEARGQLKRVTIRSGLSPATGERGYLVILHTKARELWPRGGKAREKSMLLVQKSARAPPEDLCACTDPPSRWAALCHCHTRPVAVHAACTAGGHPSDCSLHSASSCL